MIDIGRQQQNQRNAILYFVEKKSSRPESVVVLLVRMDVDLGAW